MPVTALQHRVIIGLFQSKIMVRKYFCDMDFINEFVDVELIDVHLYVLYLFGYQ